MSLFTGLARFLGKIGKWSSVGVGFIPHLGQAMTIVEMISDGVATLKGQQKQEKAIELLKYLVATAEGVSGKDLVNDPEVIKFVKAAMDALVALQNVLAKKSA